MLPNFQVWFIFLYLFLQQTNLKQKFVALLKRFKVSEDVSILHYQIYYMKMPTWEPVVRTLDQWKFLSSVWWVIYISSVEILGVCRSPMRTVKNLIRLWRCQSWSVFAACICFIYFPWWCQIQTQSLAVIVFFLAKLTLPQKFPYKTEHF